jgi:HAD superfamily hydrolase (TIGR01509 family)
MKLKAILFDLDGVLVNTRTLHYETFRQAYELVCPPRKLTWKEHLTHYDGLSTRQKLQKMLENGLITSEQSEAIFSAKQSATLETLPSMVQARPVLKDMLRNLQSQGFILACASNSVRKTLDLTLQHLEISEFFTLTLSNNDVSKPKPSPEIYSLCFEKLGVSADECLICEDSVHGRKAAELSGAHLLPIEDAEDLTYEKVMEGIQTIEQQKEKPKKPKIQIIIPMAGEGSRFRTAGYTVPKPFIEVLGKPMIQWVIENVHSSDYQLEYIFLCRKSHIEQYDAIGLFNSLGIHYSIVPVETLTEGAACTVLLAKDKLSLEDPMVIVNSDQFLEWDANIFYTCLLNPTYDGIISTFYSPDPSDTKWSFVKVTPDLFISEVAEKVWLGPNATTGIYGWKKASDFIHYANTMIAKNIRTKNEFYVCPVYNEAIQDNKKLRTLDCKKLWGLGIPEDLDIFIQRFAKESDLAV